MYKSLTETGRESTFQTESVPDPEPEITILQERMLDLRTPTTRVYDTRPSLSWRHDPVPTTWDRTMERQWFTRGNSKTRVDFPRARTRSTSWVGPKSILLLLHTSLRVPTRTSSRIREVLLPVEDSLLHEYSSPRCVCERFPKVSVPPDFCPGT